MDEYLPKGEQFIRKAAIISLASAYTYPGDKSKSQILDMYIEASTFGLSQLKYADEKKEGSFMHALNKQLEDEEESDMQQTSLILNDFLVQDYVNSNYSMSGTEFKSAISAYDIQSEDKFMEQINKVVEQLK
jgi:hypothetical protein